MDKKIKLKKNQLRDKRKKRIRTKIFGTATCPRLTVFRSLNHIYAQIIDDTTGKTLVSASSASKELTEVIKNDDKKTDVAKKVGTLLAKKAVESEIKTVSFDRNGYLFHGRVKALADSAREAGLQF